MRWVMSYGLWVMSCGFGVESLLIKSYGLRVIG